MARFTESARADEVSRDEEADLISRVESGDQPACAKLFALFGPQMKITAQRFLRCEDDCNDAVQDAFISAFNSIGRFNRDSCLSTWLHRVTVNSCLMKLRADSSRREVGIDALSSANCSRAQSAELDDPLFGMEANELRALVHGAIDKLPPADRAVVLLRDIEQQDASATAAVLHTSVHNVKRRLRRARQELTGFLEPHFHPIPSSNIPTSRACI